MRTYKKKIAKKPPASFIINKHKQDKSENSFSTDENLEQSEKVQNNEKRSSKNQTAKMYAFEKKLQKEKLLAQKSVRTSDKVKGKKSVEINYTSKKPSSQKQQGPKLQNEKEILQQFMSGSMGKFEEVLKENSDKFLKEVEFVTTEVEALMEKLGFDTEVTSIECVSADEDVASEDLTEEEKEFVEKNFGRLCEDITKVNKDATEDGKMSDKVKKFMLSNLISFRKDLQSLKDQELSELKEVLITTESGGCSVKGKTPQSNTLSSDDLKFDMVENMNVLADMNSFLKEKNNSLKEVPIKDAGAFVEELFSSVKDRFDSFGDKKVECEILKSSNKMPSGVVVSIKGDLLDEKELFLESNNQPDQKS